MMQTTENLNFHACACIVRLQVLISNVNTRLQRIINRFCLKNPGLSVASDARNVVRPKQGRLKM